MAPASSASPGRQPAGTSGKARERRAVVFDTSFLMAVMEHPTSWSQDITENIGGFTPVVLGSVRDELARLAAKGDRKGKIASLILELVANGTFTLEPDGRGKPDDEIVSYALREGAAVATIDSELAKSLRASHVQTVITLHGGRVST